MEDINEITKISTKGQLVIPQVVRDDLGLKPGIKVYWKSARTMEDDDKMVIIELEILRDPILYAKD